MSDNRTVVNHTEPPRLDIPAIAELAKKDQWVCWQSRNRGGKETKVPITPNNTAASTADPTTWSSFEVCAQAFVNGIGDGVGFVFTNDDPYVGIDLDHCLDGDGKPNEQTVEILELLPSYAERSPGGDGLHVIVRGDLPRAMVNHESGVEIYPKGRYFTMSGQHWPDSPKTIEECTGEIEELRRRFSSGPKKRREFSANGKIQPLGRHQFLLDMGNDWWRHNGGDEDAVFAHLCQLRDSRCEAPEGKGDDELRKIARWIVSRERRAPATEAEAASEIALELGHNILYVHEWRKALLWREHLYERDRLEEVHRIVRERLLELRDRIDMGSGSEEEKKKTAKKQFNLLFKLDSRQGIDNLTRLVQRHHAILPEELDANPMLLGVRNGVLDLEHGKRRDGDPRDLITRRADVIFDASAKAPVWQAFLEMVLPYLESREFVQIAAGYSLTGLTDEQSLFLLHGAGANGKTTFLERLRGLLGDYGKTAAPSTLLAKRGDSVPNDVAALAGVRFVVATEAGGNRAWDTETVKRLTGGDTVSARFMRAEYFEFQPICKIWYGLNDLPQAAAEDEALWRRIKLVPFTVRIPEDDQDQRLAMKLDQERPGILNWALEGLRKWQQDGLPCVETLADAAREYRNTQDPLRDWFDECCSQSSNWSPTGELFQSWKQYCFNSNEDQGNIRSFGKRLAKRQEEFKIRHERKNVGGGFWGIMAVVPKRD